MKDWWSVAEIRAASVLTLPRSRRRVQLLLAGCQHRTRRGGRGGEREYHISSLPVAAQAALVLSIESELQRGGEAATHLAHNQEIAGAIPAPATKLSSDSAAATALPVNGAFPSAPAASHLLPAPANGTSHAAAESSALWARFNAAPQSLKDEAARRLQILRAVEGMVAAGTKWQGAYAAVLKDDAPSTVRDWRRLLRRVDRADHLAGLIPHHAGSGARREYAEEVYDLVKADYLRREQPPFRACYDRAARVAQARGLVMPSLWTLKRQLQREIPWQAIRLARHGAEALKHSYPPQERDRSIFHAMQAVNADGHTWDVAVLWPGGEVRRPCMVAFQDLYSNKILSWRVDRSENADAVRLAAGDMCELYGVPDQLWIDNGRAFASKWMTGGMAFRYRFKVRREEPTGLFTALGIRVHWTTPYHGQAKPIERAFGDFCKRIASHPAFAGAYKLETHSTRAVPLDRFLTVIEQEIAAHNARPGRRTRVANGRSFDAVFNESYARSPIRKVTAEHRHLWLLAAELAASSVDGVITLCGNRYFSDATATMAGQRIVARFDPQNLHREIYIYRRDGSYVGAADCLVAAGFNDTQAAREHNRLRNQNRQAMRLVLETERRLSARVVAAAMPAIVPPAPPESRVVRPVRPRVIAPPLPKDDPGPLAGLDRALGERWSRERKNIVAR